MKMTMIMDGNHAFMSSVYALHRANSLHGQLFKVLEYKFNRYAGLFSFSKIFFASDSGKSWRYKIYNEYKAKRVKDQDVDWTYAFEVYEEFKQYLITSEKAILLESPGIESDDWIYVVSKKSNASGMGCLVVSGDSDLHQLLAVDTAAPWLNIQLEGSMRNGPETAVVSENYVLVVDKLNGPNKVINKDPFNLTSDTNDIINGLINEWQVKTIDPSAELFKKLLTGDSTDNIPSPYKFQQNTKNGVRNIGIGAATASKVFANHASKRRSIDPSSPTFIRDTVESIKEFYGTKIADSDVEDIRNGLALNRRMIYLHHKNYDDSMKAIMRDSLNESF